MIERVVNSVVTVLVVGLLALLVWSRVHHDAPAPAVVAEHTALLQAKASRDSLHVLGASIDSTQLRPALHRDASARRELNRVVGAIDTIPSFVDDNPRVALGVLETAALASDSASAAAIGVALSRISVAEAEAAASDTATRHAEAETLAERDAHTRDVRTWRLRAAGAAIVAVLVLVFRR